jgi:hypothetical protein
VRAAWKKGTPFFNQQTQKGNWFGACDVPGSFIEPSAKGLAFSEMSSRKGREIQRIHKTDLARLGARAKRFWMAKKSTYKIGDAVIFRIIKCSNHPGPRAARISPEPKGEQYQYEVDKYWTVTEILEDDSIVLQTRRGKRHTVRADNPRLRRATLLERIIHRDRFPSPLVAPPADSVTPTNTAS